MPKYVRTLTPYYGTRSRGASLIAGQTRARTDLDDLGFINDPDNEAFMAVTSITPLHRAGAASSSAVYQGNMLLETGTYQLYAFAGIVGTGTLTITVEDTAALSLATISTSSVIGTVGPSGSFTIASQQYVRFTSLMAAANTSWLIETISIKRV